MTHALRKGALSLLVGLSLCALSVQTAAAQTEPTISVTPNATNVVLSGSVSVTVLACAYESGTNMIDINTIDIRANGVNVTSDFTMENADPAECNFFGNQSDEVFVKWTGTVSVGVTSGPVTVTGKIYSLGSNLYQSSKTYYPPAARRSVVVMAQSAFVTPGPGDARSERFAIVNTGSDTATFSLSVSGCSTGAIATSCSVSPSSTVSALAAGSTTYVTVSYTASSSVGTTGLLRLLAVRSAATAVRDSAWVDVTVAALPAVGVHLFGNAPGRGDYLPRGACATVALTSNAASECGDLRITHALPAVRTMGTTRAPVLLYNSAHARPRPLVQADIRLNASGSLPSDGTTSIVRTDTSATCGSRTTAGTAWGAVGNTRRVVVPFSGCPVTTGIAKYRVQFSSSNQTHISADTGRLFIVNRSGSRFGPGWWLAGLERLHFVNSTELLWIGGEGSVRRYVKSGGTWRVPTAYASPDTIVEVDSGYVRRTAEHAEVYFDSAGRHRSTRTIDRHLTRFVYGGSSDSLVAIHLPVAVAGDSVVYRFFYNESRVDSIVAPGGRRVRLQRNGARIAGIVDPDGDTTSFGYSSAPNEDEIIALRDRAGARTVFAFDSVRRVTGATRPLANVLSIAPGESKGLTPTPVDSTFTQIDGPRGDVSDVGRLWMNGFGAITRSRNAVGQETSVRYSSTWPGLADRSVGPTRLTSVSVLLANRALVDSVIVEAPYGSGNNAVTRYSWHATRNWITGVRARTDGTQLRLQDSISYSGDTTVAWQQREANAGTRVTFAYTTTATGARLPLSVTAPGNRTTTYSYDGRGNVRKLVSPLGFVTLVVNDSLGRPVTTYAPRDTGTRATDSAQVLQHGVRTTSHYDALSRDTMHVTVGPRVVLSTGRVVPVDTVRVNTRYDAVGRTTRVTRSYSQSGDTIPNPLNALNPTEWTYDSLGRVTAYTEASFNGSRTYAYDAAGNVTSLTSPRGLTITSSYDAMNRLVRRITPSVTYSSSNCQWFGSYCSYAFPTLEGSSLCIGVDTAWFAYDQSGGLRVADNNWARIRRNFAPNGAQMSETQTVRTFGTQAPNSCGGGDRHAGAFSEAESDWASHVYQVSFGYDLLGRRTSLTLPSQLDPCSGSCVQSYTYAPTGELDTLKHPSATGGTLTTRFTYDGSGRLLTYTAPGGVTLTLGYDAEGRVSTRTGSGGHPASDVLTYDAGGRVIVAAVGTDSSRIEYSGLGALQRAVGLATGLTSEDYRTNGLGSVLWTRDPDMVDGINRTKVNTYGSATGRLESIALGSGGNPSCPLYNDSCHPSWYTFGFGQSFDNAGNVIATYEYDTEGISANEFEVKPRESRHYYGADERLMYSNTMLGFIMTQGTGNGTFDEYRYDALGRRVLTRTRRVDPTCASPCDAFIERTVYDGDQVLAEIRSSGQIDASATVLESEGVAAQNGSSSGWTDPTYPALFGIVVYAHALGIDDPSHVLKYRPDSGWTSFTPHKDWRGEYGWGSQGNGSACVNSRCPAEWESRAVNAYGRELGTDPVSWTTWYGSLVRGRKDANGLTFLRNRYYSSATGQFTQPDPIGLAGGLNLYGYAGGDPINHSDPFGLCKEKDLNCKYLVNALRQQGGSAFTAAAQRYDDLSKGVVSFIAISQLGAWNQSLGVRGLYDTRTENVWLVGESSRADFLLTAVHEALHMGGIAEDDPALAQGVYDAYMQMSADDRATATWTRRWLQERGKLEEDKKESTTNSQRNP